jgi:Raf kinase inhibitor-like YbhB/YbcL family protein
VDADIEEISRALRSWTGEVAAPAPKNKRGERTREHLLESATTTFVRMGYVNCAVEDILQDADVSRGTFYSHFKSKKAIFAAVIARSLTSRMTSTDVSDGEALPMPHVSGVMGAGGQDRSPQLSWSGFPYETAAFAVTCFDPDAPTGSGFWHWMLLNLDPSVTSLPSGADAHPPAGAVQLRNDGGKVGYMGAAPPSGDYPHRYIFAVHALGKKVDVAPDASNAVGAFNLTFAVLARGLITPVYRNA